MTLPEYQELQVRVFEYNALCALYNENRDYMHALYGRELSAQEIQDNAANGLPLSMSLLQSWADATLARKNLSALYEEEVIAHVRYCVVEA